MQKLKSLNEGFVNEMMADHKRKLEQQDLTNKRQNVKCVHAVFQQTLKKAGVQSPSQLKLAADTSLE